VLFEYSISGKWLELLKQIAPDVTRVAVVGDPSTATGPAQFGVIQAVASSLRVEVSALNKLDANSSLRLTRAGPPAVKIRPPCGLAAKEVMARSMSESGTDILETSTEVRFTP